MKKTFFLMAFCAGAMVLFAQENNHHHNTTPPQSVQHSWQKDYPNYSNTTWTYTNNQWHTRYQDRDHDNRNVDVYYDRNGHRVMSQMEWNRNDLPEVVRYTRFYRDYVSGSSETFASTNQVINR